MDPLQPKKKGRKKKTGEGSDNATLAYFWPSMSQKVQILNYFKVWNSFLWGQFFDGVDHTEREARWITAVEFVKSLNIPNCPGDTKKLQKLWTDWKYAYTKKENAEKQTGSAPVVWNEAELIIREIMAGNRYHLIHIKVSIALLLVFSIHRLI